MKKTLLAMALGLTLAGGVEATDATYRLGIHCGVGHMTADRFTLKEQAQYHAGLQKTLLVANEVLAKGGTGTDAVMVAIN